VSDEANSTTTPGARPGSTTDASTAVLAEDVLDGRYRLQHRVARRGPVALWRGDDLVLARPVAVRVMAHADSESSAGLLIAAAVRSGRLVHAGAASTYDATTTETASGTVAYVVSEWVDGSTLTALLEDGPLSPDRAVRVVLAVARVLVAAHGREVAHGDLHPGDVVLTPHGGVKVLDLEVRAALTAEIAEASLQERSHRDVRALGALLYACLTGRWPLPGDRGLPAAPTTSDGSLCTPRQVRAGVPRDLDALALAALDPDRDGERDGPLIQSAADMVEALESVPVNSTSDDNPYSAGYEHGPDGPTLVEPHIGGRLPSMRRGRFRARRVIVPLALLVVCAVAAWLLGVAMGRLPGPSNKLPSLAPQNNQPGPALSLTGVRSFDPQGDGTEQDSTVPLSHDGDQSTGWTTDTYKTSNFGNLKGGVGLKIDFGRPEKVRSVRLTFAAPGESVELRAADADSNSIDGFPVRAQVVGGDRDMELTPTDEAPHQYWVVWLTQLPQTDRGFRAELDEMVFLS
jgi:serine/threonine protein kinase